jgi:hypothetical protein
MTINEKMSEKFDGLAALIGHTPMLEISLLYKGEPRIVYAKAEYYNYSGSIKDRVACHILRQAYETGAITEGMPIAEATSGNTGIAFAAIGAYLGNPVTIFMPDWMSKERINLIESFGATIRLVSKAEGGFTGSIALADRMGETEGAFLPHQFSNPENCAAHYATTGKRDSGSTGGFRQKTARLRRRRRYRRNADGRQRYSSGNLSGLPRLPARSGLLPDDGDLRKSRRPASDFRHRRRVRAGYRQTGSAGQHPIDR